MISDKTRANRLRRHRRLKRLYEAQLENAVSDRDKKYLEGRIAEVDRDIVTTQGDSVKTMDTPPIPVADEKYVKAQLAEIPEKERIEGVTPPEPKPLLSAITKTAEEDAKKPEEPKKHRKTKVGNPF